MQESNDKSSSFYTHGFHIFTLIKTSYKYTKGFKGTMWAMIIIAALCIFLIYFLLSPFFPSADLNSDQFKQNMEIISFFALPITAILWTGIDMAIISYLRGKNVSYKAVFAYFPLIVKLSLASLLIHVIYKSVFYSVNIIGQYFNVKLTFLAYLLSGFIAILYSFTLPLIADKGLKIWNAMELSRRAVYHHFFKIVFFYLGLALILMISAIPLGIGLIWTMPMFYIGFIGLLYRIIFDGVNYDYMDQNTVNEKNIQIRETSVIFKAKR